MLYACAARFDVTENFESFVNFWESYVRLSYKPYFLCQPKVFFSHNKLANNIFNHGFSDHQQGTTNAIS